MQRLHCLKFLSLIILVFSLGVFSPVNSQPSKTRQRPLFSREGRFLSAHLDLLSAASSIFPSFKPRDEETPSKADKLVATEEDLTASDTIEDMSNNLEDVQSFGAKLNTSPSEADEVIAEQIDAMDASGCDPPEQLEEIFEAKTIPFREEKPKLVEVYKDPKDALPSYSPSPYNKPLYGGYKRPEGTPVPLVIICEDPNYCPPPSPYPNSYGPPRPSYGGGLTICKDPNDCPAPYGKYPPPRPYRIKRPTKKPTKQPPTYHPSNPSRRPLKKYGYNPKKSNPTIWRQQVMKVRKPATKQEEEEVQEDPQKGLEVEHETIKEMMKFQEDFVKSSPPEETSVDEVSADDIESMSMAELKNFIKDVAMEEMKENQVEKLTVVEDPVATVAPVVEEAISKMTMKELKEFIMETVMDDDNDLIVAPISENGVKQMSMKDMKELIKDTVAQNESPEELVIPLVEDAINEMSKNELEEVIMDTVEEKDDSEDIVVPLVEEAIKHMSMTQLKNFIEDTVVSDNEDANEVIAPLVEDVVSHMSKNELKEFVMDKVVENMDMKKTKIKTAPETEEDINNLSMDELREFIDEKPNEEKESEKITIPEDAEDINQMSMEELREFIGDTSAPVPTSADEINQMSMEELRDFINLNSVPPVSVTERPMVKVEMQKDMQPELKGEMIIKDGMLMKDGMTMKEIKAEDMGMSVKEMVSLMEGLTQEEVSSIKDGVSVEEMIAMKNDVTVGEMIAMKNDISMEEVKELKNEMTAEEILIVKPEIEVEEVVALKSDMTVEEMVAMKNDMSVEDVLELKDEITMVEIMSLQDGMTKEDIVAVVENVVTVDEVIEMKEKLEQMSEMNGIQIVSNIDTIEPVLGPGGIEEMANDMEVIDLDTPNKDSVKFIEIFDEPEMMKPTVVTPEDEILEAVINDSFQSTKTPSRGNSMLQMMKSKDEKKETRKKLKMKMRPMRVKVRKPVKKFQSFMTNNEKKTPKPNLGFNDDSIESMVDEEFGLKKGFTNADLVLDPTPAVPGRPIIFENDEEPSVVRNNFNEFLPSTTPVPVIPVENIKTEDFPKEDASNAPKDYPIYDTEPDKPFPPIKMSEFPNMPIFSNFPMMGPNEFVQPTSMESPDELDFMGFEMEEDYGDYMKKESFSSFNEDRPESINLFKEDPQTTTAPQDDKLSSLVSIFNEEAEIQPDVRPVRRPSQNPVRSPPKSPHRTHPNHRYPVHRPTQPPAQYSPTPFTVRTRNTIVPHSYIKNSFKHSNSFRSGIPSFGDFDTSNTALFREIPETPIRKGSEERFKRKPYQESFEREKIKPFTRFGSFKEENERTEKVEVKKQRPSVGFSEDVDVKPFTNFGPPQSKKRYPVKPESDTSAYSPPKVEPQIEVKEENMENFDGHRDYNDPSLVGINFYKQYGQHDDRPLQLPTAPTLTAKDKQDPVEYEAELEDDEDESSERRPGEIRFGGMSFALPPPGAFPDIPEEEYEEYEYDSQYDYDARPVSDVYPNHPVSAVFPNRPVSEVFRDLPNREADPTFPTAFPTPSGITIVDSDVDDVPGFDNFFSKQKSYLDNPFGGDFIKLEIDRDRFDTNKTGPGVHHIPLDVYGYPDVPTYKTYDDSAFGPKVNLEKKSADKAFKIEKSKASKTKSNSKKPLYKPPPVLTEYTPPKSSSIPEYKHQYPAVKAQKKKDDKDPLTNLPNALQNLPMFMERLMGNHADWVQRAWRGRERDESAAA